MNLLAFPGQPAQEHESCAALLTALGESDGTATLLRAQSTGDRFQGCGDGNNYSLNAGEGYFAELGEAHEIVVNPAVGCAPANLVPGINLIGHPRPEPGLTCRAWLGANDPLLVRSIARFDPATSRFKTCVWYNGGDESHPVGMDLLILPGEGYRIFGAESGALERPGCD